MRPGECWAQYEAAFERTRNGYSWRTRNRTPGRLDRVRWAAHKPFKAFLFRVTNDYKIYTFVLPLACANLSLMSITEIEPAPVDVEAERTCDPATGMVRATIKATGKDLERVQRVSVAVDGQPAGELVAPSWTFIANRPGTYTFDATDKRGRSYPVARRSLRLDACPAAPPEPTSPPASGFPWPPPPWTHRRDIPMNLISPGVPTTYGTAFERVKTAVRRAEIREWSVYELDNDGFAVVTELETINRDGTPLKAARWLESPPLLALGFREILHRLSSVDRGYFRIIVILVTTRAIIQDPSGDPNQIRGLASLEEQRLSPSLSERLVDARTAATALVYEFKKQVGNGPHWVEPSGSNISAGRHLTLARLWTAEELR